MNPTLPLEYITALWTFRKALKEAQRLTDERYPVGSRWRLYGPSGEVVTVYGIMADAPDWIGVEREGGKRDTITVDRLWPVE